MNFNGLLEELKDIPIRNVLYHGTDFFHFAKMLKTGSVGGSDFYIKATNKNRKELATSRKSGITNIESIKDEAERNKKLADLSSNIGNIRFHLYIDRIRGGKEHRYVTVKPLAEIPVSMLDELARVMGEQGYTLNRKQVNKLMSVLLSIYKERGGKWEDSNGSLKTFESKIEQKLDIFLRKGMAKLLFKAAENYYKYLINRENEERIVFGNIKNSKIRFNPDFLKIEFLSGIVDEVSNYIEQLYDKDYDDYTGYKTYTTQKRESNSETAKTILTNLQKYDNVIIQNKNYEELKSFLNKIIKKGT